MALAAADVALVQAFRQAIMDKVEQSPGLALLRAEPAAVVDRADNSTMAVRYTVGGDSYFEVAVRPFIPQVRVGVATESRWRNEELEEKIEETGDEMDEYIEQAFADIDLDWPTPPVEHYREQQKWFYFATPLEPPSLSALDDEALREKTFKMLLGYWEAFGKAYMPKPA